MAGSEATESPIFLLGVGRCGSTNLQLQLCQLPDTWIWGEHDGVLKGLFAWTDQIRTSESLREFSFSQSTGDPAAIVGSQTGGDATHLAWMNGFRLPHIDQIERGVIEDLCAKRLPPGKQRWGFKEIRYGLGDQVPERLLRLYPNARIIHTVRDPFMTTESSLFAWNFDQLKTCTATGQQEVLYDMYDHYVSRWITAVEHFDRLRREYPDRVRFSCVERLAADRDLILQFLGIERGSEAPQLQKPVNPGNRISRVENSMYLAHLQIMRSIFVDRLRGPAEIAGYKV